MSWFAQAPANIALIKYMGKKGDDQNTPDNSSLSYTLNNLLSSVTLETITGLKDIWEPLLAPGTRPFKLSIPSQERFLKHLKMLKDYYNYSGAFLVRSSNNFPTGSGLASSASSFAALSLCAIRALSELQQVPKPDVQTQAQLSRLGSGSSCRSFFSPWALWQEGLVKAIELPYKKLVHQVVIISHAEKHVSSSEAHRRVRTSPLYADRAQRAEDNLQSLLKAFEGQNWPFIKNICWQEFYDMHRLFETCDQPFSYMTDKTQALLSLMEDVWQNEQDGPIVTMDAGPNVHLLYREDQYELAQRIKCDYLVGEHDVL